MNIINAMSTRKKERKPPKPYKCVKCRHVSAAKVKLNDVIQEGLSCYS